MKRRLLVQIFFPLLCGHVKKKKKIFSQAPQHKTGIKKENEKKKGNSLENHNGP
jgi:hypothetical protein